MSEKPQWSLREIRAAYTEILRAYNALLPLNPDIKKMEEETLSDSIEIDEEGSYLKTMKRLKKAHNSLKEGANESGNPQVWHRGESLNGLNQGMKERIERGLKFGI